MKVFILSRLAMVAMIVILLAVQVLAQGATNLESAQQATGTTKRVIVVSLVDRKLALVEDGQVKKVYSVAVGKPSTPSPTGTFTIERRVANPTYHHDGKTVLPGPGNPVGTRWMGLSIHGYGIHGTNEPHSIGKAASHGCIRMGRADLEEFYQLVAIGDTVELLGEQNEETAQLFGDGQSPAALAAPPVQSVVAATGAAPIEVPAPTSSADASSTEKTNLGTSAVTVLSALR